MRPVSEALRAVEQFAASPEEHKSKELILALLEKTQAPFSRDQYHPGHITCSAVVLSPDRKRVLLMHHHRHRRWLLPGGHVEKEDPQLADAAHREAEEETAVRIASSAQPAAMVGMDVHAIPARKGEPFHLHHDLIFAFEAESDEFAPTDEAPQVAWCGPAEFELYAVPPNVVRAARRAFDGP